MSSPFQHLKMDRELACELLGVFARFEFALKARGYALGDGSRVNPDWDRFAKAITPQFDRNADREFATAVQYLLTQPPKKQILNGRKLEWCDAPPDGNQCKAKQVLLMVRRVRNNLFHGGKFSEDTSSSPNRDSSLVENSLVVLRTCLVLNGDVAAAYNN